MLAPYKNIISDIWLSLDVVKFLIISDLDFRNIPVFSGKYLSVHKTWGPGHRYLSVKSLNQGLN